MLKGASILCLSCIPLLQAVPPAGQQKPVPPAGQPANQQKPTPPTAPALFPLAVVWSRTLDAPPSAPAGFDGSLAYVPLRTERLVAVSLTNGEPRWTVDVATKFAPATGNDLVFVATLDGVAALAPSDGAPRWRVATDKPPSAAPYWDAGRLVLGTEGGDLLVIDAQDGRTLWKRSIGSPLTGSPTFAPDRLLVSLGDGRVVALEPATGHTLWEQKLDETPGEMATADHRVYVGSRDRYLYCLSLADGRVRWRWQTGGAIIGRPIVDDRSVYFLSMDNLLRALDRAGGNQRWKTSLPTRASNGLCLLDGKILTAGNTALNAFQRHDGVAAGSYAAPADLVGLPHVARGLGELDAKIFIVTGDGDVLALQSAAKTPAPAKIPAPTRRPEPGGD